MRSIDWRTRGLTVAKADPVSFFEGKLPAQLQETGELAGRGARQLGLDPLALEVDGRSWTLRVVNGSLEVVAGDSGAATKAVLESDAFSDLIDDFKSTLGIAIAGRVQITQGKTAEFVAWEPVLRAALDGRAVYEPGQVELLDRYGRPLDLESRFHGEDLDNAER